MAMAKQLFDKNDLSHRGRTRSGIEFFRARAALTAQADSKFTVTTDRLIFLSKRAGVSAQF
jgi:hypothetical protein